MKILFFIRSLAIGGSQRQLMMLAQGLQRRGHEIAVAVLYTGDEMQLAHQADAVRIIDLGKRERWHVIKPLTRLRALLHSERPDILYAFQPTQTVLAALLMPRTQPARLIFGIRASAFAAGHYDALSAFAFRLEAMLSRRADLVIANSRAGSDHALARGMPADRIAIVPNGIDAALMAPNTAAGVAQRRQWGVPGDAFVVGCVARFDPMKDHPTFLRAAGLFLQRHHDAYFVCVGYGAAPYVAELKKAANNIGLADRVVWTSAGADMQPPYNAFDIATLSSAFGEGFPNVIGEAMACGVPVAATDIGEARAIIGSRGEVVPPRNPDALCAAWERLRARLKAEPDLRDEVRAAIIANYSAEAMVGRTEKIFQALLANRPPAEIVREIA